LELHDSELPRTELDIEHNGRGRDGNMNNRPAVVPDANARAMAALAVAGSAGTYVGTAAVSLLGAARCLLLDSASYVISAWCASRISTVHAAQHSARSRTRMITSILRAWRTCHAIRSSGPWS
jgi:hypothetical protein